MGNERIFIDSSRRPYKSESVYKCASLRTFMVLHPNFPFVHVVHASCLHAFFFPIPVLICDLLTLQMDNLIHGMDIPRSIALTKALKENVFSVVVSVANNIPLIMVGEPGSSKTLSVTLAAANLKGEESTV